MLLLIFVGKIRGKHKTITSMEVIACTVTSMEQNVNCL